MDWLSRNGDDVVPQGWSDYAVGDHISGAYECAVVVVVEPKTVQVEWCAKVPGRGLTWRLKSTISPRKAARCNG